MSLGDLSLLPQYGDVVTCERNSKLMTTDANLVSDYHKIILSNDGKKRKNLASHEMAQKPIFLEKNDAFFSEILSSWEKKGLNGVFQLILSHQESSPSLIYISEKLSVVTNLWNSMKDKVFAGQEPKDEQQRKFTMVCHPYTSKIAVANHEVNDLKVVDVDSNGHREFVLKDKRLTKVSCMAWRPMSALSLAVGCTNGILVWFIDGDINISRGGSNVARLFVPNEIKTDVTSLSWSNNGILLAAAYKKSASFVIWNVITQQHTVIQRAGSPTSFLLWSNCDQRLFTPTETNIFRVWETQTWTCDKWTDLNGKCTNACWSSDGSILLFTVENDMCIYAISFYKSKASFSSSDTVTSSTTAQKCADLTPTITNNGVTVGGLVSSMVWDATNSRLAVTFYEDGRETNQKGIGLFHTKIHPTVQLIPCGFVQGDVDEVPVCIDFNKSFDKGAQLVIFWSSNSISIIPCYFNKDLAYQHSAVTMATSTTIVGSNTFYDSVHNTSVVESSWA